MWSIGATRVLIIRPRGSGDESPRPFTIYIQVLILLPVVVRAKALSVALPSHALHGALAAGANWEDVGERARERALPTLCGGGPNRQCAS